MVLVQSPPEQRMVLHGISWETYESLLADHEDRSAPRFTYDRGTLEIMSPLPLHERYTRAIESLMDALALETDRNIDTGVGSTTFRSTAARRGFEPDACFYARNRLRIRGERPVDLRVDPPPDVVVEIDITHSSLDKLPIYAQFGVPEVWRYDGERLEILLLEGDRYVASRESRAIPLITAYALSDLLRGSEGLEWSAWLRRARTWARELEGSGG